MLALTILTVGILSVMMVFGSMLKAVHASKGKSLATNLAQEKIESLKNLSYYRLLVTTTTVLATEPGIDSFPYDNGYYPSDSFSVGEINFIRRVFVQKMTESAGTLTANNWWDNDEGLKQVTCYVLWQDAGIWNKVSMTNLRDNPNRKKMDSKINPLVKSGGVPVQNVSVFTLQNNDLKATTDNTGGCSISVPSGNYDVAAVKRGYFTLVINTTAPSNGNITVPFNLSLMGTGQVTGVAYLNNHLLISHVCAEVNGDDNLEYVTLYNPTDIPFVVAPGGAAAPNYRLRFVQGSPPTIMTTINKSGKTIYVNTVIPAHGYFVIGSSNNINGIIPDAYYSDSALISNIPDNRIPALQSGGIALVSQGVYEINGSTVDAIGWDKNGGTSGPDLAREGPGLALGPAKSGLNNDEFLERIAYSSSTHFDMDISPAGIHSTQGNAYDTDNNATDWVLHAHGSNDIPQNSSSIELPGSGTPAINARVFLDDGLSASANVTSNPIPGNFTVTNVATGTWAVLISSGGWAYYQEGNVVTNGGTTNLGNVHISSPASGGFIAGRVTTLFGIPLSSILVSASGKTDTTDSSGGYWLTVDPGTYTVLANEDNRSASSYTQGSATGVVVNAGALTTAPEIRLYPGGVLSGWVTTNGTDALPGIPVVATSAFTGAEAGSAISDTQGNFSFPNLAFSNYTFSPQLEVGESANPPSIVKSVVIGQNVSIGTFTIVNAFGSINGSLTTINGSSITTGVLIVAVPQPNTVGTTPPTNDQTLRTGGIYYYSGSSASDGTFSISVRGGATYNVYAWYTTYSASGVPTNPAPQMQSIPVPAGKDVTLPVPFQW